MIVCLKSNTDFAIKLVKNRADVLALDVVSWLLKYSVPHYKAKTFNILLFFSKTIYIMDVYYNITE